MYTFLDDRKVCNDLPIYASDSPDSVPYLRIIDGDFKLLAAKMDKMADQILKLQEIVHTLQPGKFTTLCSIDTSTRADSGHSLDHRSQPHTVASGCGYGGSSMVTGQTDGPCFSGLPGQQLGNSTILYSSNRDTRPTDWATHASVTNHHPIGSMNSSHAVCSVVHSRVAAVAANGELSSQDDSSVPFQPVSSRRARRRNNKRQRV